MDRDYLFSGLTVDSILTKNLKTIHQENGLSPPIMNDVFILRQTIYILQKFQKLSYGGPQLWNSLIIKSKSTVELFKIKVWNWKHETGNWNLFTICRLYQLTKTLASTVQMVRTNLFYFGVLKNCIGVGGWFWIVFYTMKKFSRLWRIEINK